MGRITLVLLTVFLSSQSLAFDFAGPDNIRTVRYEMDNDSIRDRDSHFTSGWSLQYHSRLYKNWEDSSAPDWVKWLGHQVPSLDRPNAIVRNSFSLGQLSFTPSDLSEQHPSEDDLPYSGTLTGSISWQNFNHESARIFQITIGLLGEESLSGQLHKFSHNEFYMGKDPKGWDSQRDTEPIINFDYQYSQVLAKSDNFTDRWGWQTSLGASASLGNLNTDIRFFTLLRYGWNMLEGFSVTPQPPGLGIVQSTQIPKPVMASPHSVDMVFGISGTALLYSVIYDGSFLTSDDRDVEREIMILSGLVGINYRYKNSFAARIYFQASSDLLDSKSIPNPPSGADKTQSDPSYGALMLDYYF